jgi:small subunit ribosomal protein S8e
MAIWQGESVRKQSGGRRRPAAGKKKREIGREVVLTELGKDRHVVLRTRGGNSKTRIYRAEKVNVTDPATGKTTRAEIKGVLENAANIHYVRRNILTKGAVIETSAGKARVTSRPGQDGSVNAVKVQ